jgi:hypothetical protein
MPRDRKGQAVEPTKSAGLDQLPGGLGSGAGLVGALAAGVGHASTVRPDPSTLRGEIEAPTARAGHGPLQASPLRSSITSPRPRTIPTLRPNWPGDEGATSALTRLNDPGILGCADVLLSGAKY